MKKTKKIALIIATVVLMAVCFVFGASAETWGDYEYAVLEDGTVEITKYNGNETELVIPEMIEGKSVTVIGERSFYRCDSLTKVNLPDSVISIGKEAFRECTNLIKIVMSANLESLGLYAFENSRKIVELDFSKTNLKYIYGGAFFYCIGLKYLHLPHTVELIGGATFFTSYLDYIYYEGTEDEWNSLVENYIDDDNPPYLQIPEKVFVNEKHLKNIEVEIVEPTCTTEGVKTTKCFCGCNYVYAESLAKVPKHTYDEAIITPPTCTSEGYTTYICKCGDRYISDYVKVSDHTYTEEILTKPTCINGGQKQLYCTSCHIYIYQSLPKSDEHIDNDYNGYCDRCGKMCAYKEGNYYYVIKDDEAIIILVDNTISGDIIIPSTLGGYPVTTIGKRAFCDCNSLTSVTISCSVTTVGDYALASCDNLTSVTIGDSVTIIGYQIFSGCKNLENLTIGKGVKKIPERYCSELSNLKTVNLSEGLEEIGVGAFQGCENLESIIIPYGVTEIKKETFESCVNLKNVVIPDSVITIGEESFYGCENLESIDLPESVVTIDEWAFRCCRKLKTLFIPENVSFIGYEIFEGDLSLETIIVDENNKVYSSDENGVLFDKDKTKLICYPAGSKTTEYLVPSTVETICSMSFFSVLYLEKIKLPDNLKKIEEESFGYNFGLTEITIPASVESIGEVGIAINNFVERIIVESMDAELGVYSLNPTQFEFFDITKEELIDIWKKVHVDNDVEAEKKLFEHLQYTENIIHLSTIYCHSGSTAETYAIENGVKYELTHFFKGDWTYDYENMIRTRKCIHCDELETEPLESTNNGDVEIIEPVDPDTDFEVDKIEGDNFLLIEEKVTNGIEGNVEVLKAFDINLKNHDGVHVQPDGTVKVKLPNNWTKQGVYKVYRVNDDGTLTDMNAYREGSHLVFETDHFSIYVIVVENEETEPDEPVVPDTPEEPTEPEESECRCFCHKKGDFFELLVIIFKFVIKIVGVAPLCDCGIAHY